MGNHLIFLLSLLILLHLENVFASEENSKYYENEQKKLRFNGKFVFGIEEEKSGKFHGARSLYSFLNLEMVAKNYISLFINLEESIYEPIRFSQRYVKYSVSKDSDLRIGIINIPFGINYESADEAYHPKDIDNYMTLDGEIPRGMSWEFSEGIVYGIKHKISEIEVRSEIGLFKPSSKREIYSGHIVSTIGSHLFGFAHLHSNDETGRYYGPEARIDYFRSDTNRIYRLYYSYSIPGKFRLFFDAENSHTNINEQYEERVDTEIIRSSESQIKQKRYVQGRYEFNSHYWVLMDLWQFNDEEEGKNSFHLVYNHNENMSAMLSTTFVRKGKGTNLLRLHFSL